MLVQAEVNKYINNLNYVQVTIFIMPIIKLICRKEISLSDQIVLNFFPEKKIQEIYTKYFLNTENVHNNIRKSKAILIIFLAS